MFVDNILPETIRIKGEETVAIRRVSGKAEYVPKQLAALQWP